MSEQIDIAVDLGVVPEPWPFQKLKSRSRVKCYPSVSPGLGPKTTVSRVVTTTCRAVRCHLSLAVTAKIITSYSATGTSRR